MAVQVSNAASRGFRALMASSALNFEATMNTNVRALMFLVQATSPLMERTAERAKVIALSELRDAADAVLFLASRLSDLIQGQTIVVDAGASTRA
jgi:NAD(P)-dependent dehydrogenase (short-subunit alcohol dehydrogenase family)